MNRDFEGKVAIVTGAGGGLGRCHALQLAERGASVVVNDLGGAVDGSGASDAADVVVEEIRAAGGKAFANKASVADRAGAQSMVDDALREFGGLHILVNNAGILRDRTFKKMSLDDFDLVMQVHLTGSAYVTHCAWPVMYEQNYGRIVFTSSGSGIYGNFGQANYGAAKMGMLGLANVLALEGRSKNIRVNCLAPAATTRMTENLPGQNADAPVRDPADVSPAVLYLCSDEAPTANVIQAAGGRFSRCAIFSNKGIKLEDDVSYEALLPHIDTVRDMSAAHSGRLQDNM